MEPIADGIFASTYSTVIPSGLGQENREQQDLVWDTESFKAEPDSLNERAEAAAKESNVLRFYMLFDCLKSTPCALSMIRFPSIGHESWESNGL